jgi:hypothetical protein
MYTIPIGELSTRCVKWGLMHRQEKAQTGRSWPKFPPRHPQASAELAGFLPRNPTSNFIPSPTSLLDIFLSHNTAAMPDPQLLSAIGFGVNIENNPELLTSTTIAAPIRKRRNGFTPACEPCRKAKVRCDTDPPGSLCGRCRKSKTPEKCIFLDAPMTRRFHEFSNDAAGSLSTPKSPPPKRRRGRQDRLH